MGGGGLHSCSLEIPVPSHLHIFSWLLTNNKVLTRDNLAKRKNVDDMRCFFCDEPESVKHLFFLSVVWLELIGTVSLMFVKKNGGD
jgi:hypothetical protein